MYIAFYSLFITDYFFTGVWPLTLGYYTRYALFSIFIVFAIKSFFNVNRVWPKNFKASRFFAQNILYLGAICFFLVRVLLVLDASLLSGNPVELEFPLKNGDFCIVHGGTGKILNHHYAEPAQKYALDIVELNHFGFRSDTWYPLTLNDFNIFNSPVYSPCDGVVIELVDRFKDQEYMVMDPEHPAGNYVAILKKDSEVVIILAHLKMESFQVGKDEIVCKGQPIALIGNSGNTSEPHLHIHAVLNHSGGLLFAGKGIPMTFKDHYLVRNDRVIN